MVRIAVLFVSSVLLLGCLAPVCAQAQVQNPIQAMKDAYKKAKQQSKQQQPQSQQTPQDSGAGQAGTQASGTGGTQASGAGGTQEAVAPWQPPADDAAGGAAGKSASQASANEPVRLDPMKLPDIVGVRLGMTAEEALTTLRKTYPGDMYQGIPANFWPSEQKPAYGYNLLSRAPGNNKDVVVSFTAPPGPQIVWQVARETQHMHINRGTLLAALREKYGKETVAYPASVNGVPARNDAQIVTLIWLYDEHGTRVPLPPTTVFTTPNAGVTECLGATAGMIEPHMPKDDDFAKGYNDWCAHHLVSLQVYLGGLDIVEYTITSMEDVPLGVRTGHAASVWLNNYAQRQHQDDLERSKAKKPVL